MACQGCDGSTVFIVPRFPHIGVEAVCENLGQYIIIIIIIISLLKTHVRRTCLHNEW